MNKDKKTYVEPNMKVVEVEAMEIMAGSDCTGDAHGGSGDCTGDSNEPDPTAKGDFASSWEE